MTKITRHFVTVGSRQVHYRRAGSGPPVVLLHPSPNSSASMAPFMRALAPNFTAIALDTPSYGLSDPLAVEEPEILRTPLVRNQNQLTVGLAEADWKDWTQR